MITGKESNSSSNSSWERIPSDYDIVSSSSPNSRTYDIVDERGFEHSGYEFYEEQQELPHAPLIDSKLDEESLTDLVQSQIDQNGPSKLNLILLSLLLWAALADAVEIIALSFILPHVQCQFNFSPIQLSILTSIIFTGLFIGSFVWGSIGDQIGRRKGLITTLSINAAFGLLSALSNSYSQLVIFRFFSGLGVGGSIPLIWSYASEISPTQRKGFYMSILSLSWMIANVATSALAYIVLPSQTVFPTWRIFMALTTIPAMTSALFFIISPESPMWLAENEQYDELISTLDMFYPGNHWKAIERCRMATRQTHDLGRYRMVQRAKGAFELYAKLLSHKYYRRTTLIAVLNFSLAFSSYGISLWMPTLFSMMEKHPNLSFCQSIQAETETHECSMTTDKSQYMDSMIFSLVQLPGNLATLILLDKVGPKIILLISLLSSVATFLCLIYARSALESFVLCCLYSLLSVLSWNSLNVLNSFLFPINIRSTATGMMSSSNRIGAWSGSLLIGLLLNSAGCGAPMILIAFVILVGFFSIMKLHVPRRF